MTLDAIELQLAAALQRYNTLRRRAEASKAQAPLLARCLDELGAALEFARVAQEQMIESRGRVEELQAELAQQESRYRQLFDELPDAYVITTPDTLIVEANRKAAELLNVSQRFLAGKALSVFVCEDRAAFLQACTGIGDTPGVVDIVLKIRPRERAPITVTGRVSGGSAELRWLLRPSALTPTE